MPPAPLAGKARRPSLIFTRKCPDKNIDGHYAFHLPDLGGAHRPLRDPDSSDDD